MVAHDRATARRIERELGVDPARVTILPHGSYLGVYPPGREREAVRAALGLPADAFVFISFGHLRRYKDLDLLLGAFRAVEDPLAGLLVAGPAFDDATVEAVRQAAEGDPRIRPVLEFVPEEGFAELFNASDAAVVARSDGGTSGALVLALSLGLPVVASDSQAYAELLGDGRAGWLFETGSEDALAAALSTAASDPEGAARRAVEARATADTLRWEEHSDCIARLVDGDGLDVNLSYA